MNNNWSSLEGKKISLTVRNGEVFQGICTAGPGRLMLTGSGQEEACLQMGDYVFFREDIQSAALLPEEKDPVRRTEEHMAMLFSVRRSFSGHMMRWTDNELPDKYDHNGFSYTGQPSEEEFRRALAFQAERGDSFIKLEGDEPLEQDFGLERNVTDTMVLEGDPRTWKKNGALVFAPPDPGQLEELDVRHYASIYGESFTRRNIRRLYKKLPYMGAFLGNVLVGACYYCTLDRCTCIDGLLVDRKYRYQKIATSLLHHVIEQENSRIVFLHADDDDTPKEMYQRLGFRISDRLYEYLGTDISGTEKSGGAAEDPEKKDRP